MTSIEIDRIETKKAEKIKRFLDIGLFIMIVILPYRLYDLLENNSGIIGAWIDFLIVFLPFFFIYWQMHKRNKDRLGQFIEWNIESIKFKLPDHNTPITIDRTTIEQISFDRDIIKIKTTNNLIYKLNIEDFGDLRNKIKRNFGVK